MAYKFIASPNSLFKIERNPFAKPFFVAEFIA